jgi:hypothetical protein
MSMMFMESIIFPRYPQTSVPSTSLVSSKSNCVFDNNSGAGGKFRHVFSCESNEAKRRFIQEVGSPSVEQLFHDTADLIKAQAHCDIADGNVAVNRANVFAAGFPCTSVSRANKKAKDHRNVVAEVFSYRSPLTQPQSL